MRALRYMNTNMKKIGFGFLAFTLTLALVLLLDMPEAHADTPCAPDIAAGSTINDNVIVVGSCAISGPGTTINGNIKVGPGGILSVSGPGVTINGSIEAKGQFILLVFSSAINGDIKVEGGPGVTSFVQVVDNMMSSNIEIKDLTGGQIRVSQNVGSGNIKIESNVGLSTNPLQVSGNTLADGNIEVNNNNALTGDMSIAGNILSDGNIEVNKNINPSGFFIEIATNSLLHGNLKCFGNSPAPIDFGLGNSVAGNKEGQCSTL